jgi:hypothetical protein
MRGQIRVKKGNPIRLWLRHLDMVVVSTNRFLHADSAYLECGKWQVVQAKMVSSTASLKQHCWAVTKQESEVYLI